MLVVWTMYGLPQFGRNLLSRLKKTAALTQNDNAADNHRFEILETLPNKSLYSGLSLISAVGHGDHRHCQQGIAERRR